MATPRRWQIAMALKDRLSAIVADAGVTAYHTPKVVLLVDDFDVQHLRSEYDCIYQIAPIQGFAEAWTTRTVDQRMEMLVLAALKAQPTTRSPYAEEKTLWETREELLQDINTALEKDPINLGVSFVHMVRAQNLDLNFEVEDAFPWVLAQARVVAQFRYQRPG